MQPIIAPSNLRAQDIAREHESLIAQLATALAMAKSARKPTKFGANNQSYVVVSLEGEDPIDPRCVVPAFLVFSRASKRETAASPIYAELRLTWPDGRLLAGYGRSLPRADPKRPSAALAAARSLGLDVPYATAWRWRVAPLLTVLALAAGWPAVQLAILD